MSLLNTVQLRAPIEIGSKTITEIEIHEPSAGALLQGFGFKQVMRQGDGSIVLEPDMRVLWGGVLSAVTRQPDAVLKKIGGRDMNTIITLYMMAMNFGSDEGEPEGNSEDPSQAASSDGKD